MLERHKSGAWHVHLAVPLWIDHRQLGSCWGHGYVFVTDHAQRRKRRTMSSEGQGTRNVAGYVAKYVSKAYEAGDGRQGYGVAEGFQPPSELVWALTERELRQAIAKRVGAQLLVRDLKDLDDYPGPPAFWATWLP